MQIAQVLAGYSLGSADLLRRAMGKKISSEMEAQRQLFVTGAVERGIDEQRESILGLTTACQVVHEPREVPRGEDFLALGSSSENFGPCPGRLSPRRAHASRTF